MPSTIVHEDTSMASVLADHAGKALRSMTRKDVVAAAGSRSFTTNRHGWISPTGPLNITAHGPNQLTTLRIPTLQWSVLAQQSGDQQLHADLDADKMPNARLARQLSTSRPAITAAANHLFNGLTYQQAARRHFVYAIDEARTEVQRTADRLRARWPQAYRWLTLHGAHRAERSRRQQHLALLTAATFADITYGVSQVLLDNSDLQIIYMAGHTAVLCGRTHGPSAARKVRQAAAASAVVLPATTINMVLSSHTTWPNRDHSSVTLFRSETGS